MRHFIKVIVTLLGIAVGLLVFITIGVRLFFPPAKLRGIVSEQVRTRLNREVQLGDVQLGLGGLTLKRLKLSETPSFTAGVFLAVDHVSVRWALLPFLSKKVVIKEIILEKPQVNMVRLPNKTLNISDLSAPPPERRTEAPEKKLSPQSLPTGQAGSELSPKKDWAWVVNRIHLRQGVIRYDDRSTAHQTSALSDIDLVLQDFDPTQVQGRLKIGLVENPVYGAKNLTAEWSLHQIDASLNHLNGWMRLKQGPGVVQNLSQLANSSPAAKLALLPLVMLQNIDRLGFIKLGLPDFSRLQISHIQGAYTFEKGTMKIDTFEIVGPQMTTTASGTIGLGSGKLAVDVNLHTPKPVLMGEMDLKLQITGTLSKPKTNLDSLKKKAFKTIIRDLQKPDAANNINKALKNIFR